MRLLDTFCGAGGCSMGYHRAGFEVVGVDIEPQKNYPFQFVQGDAIEYIKAHGREFDVIHASPPCQRYSVMTVGRWPDRIDAHPDLIMPVRKLLLKLDKPYVIENVSGARRELIRPIMLCGTMFGLETEHGNQLIRHRYFETNSFFALTSSCRHNGFSPIGVYGGGQNPARRKRRYDPAGEYLDFGIVARRQVMGIDWMTGAELNQAIPPAYTEWIGRQLLEVLNDQD